jgi:hypothetical protein
MKITQKQLKQMIKEELSEVEHLGGHSGGGVGVPGEFQPMEKEYAMALGKILGISPEEVEAMDPKRVSDIAMQIRQAYLSKGMDAPPMNEPKGGWADPFEDHPDNEQGSRQRRFESKKKK